MSTKCGRNNARALRKQAAAKDRAIVEERYQESMRLEASETHWQRTQRSFYAGSTPLGGRKATVKAQTRACKVARRKLLHGPQGGARLNLLEQQAARKATEPQTFKRNPLDPCKLADPRRPRRR